jgi:outer membrane protein assembly factor BamA
MGPIHIDLGFNLSPKKGEKQKVFDFTMGTVF